MTSDPEQAMVRRMRRIDPQEIRDAAFPVVRRGWDPHQVRVFLHHVAGELERLHREVSIASGEVARVKAALNDWQAQNAGSASTPPDVWHAPPSAPPPGAQRSDADAGPWLPDPYR
jgi:DivIVA domain-containing protein